MGGARGTPGSLAWSGRAPSITARLISLSLQLPIPVSRSGVTALLQANNNQPWLIATYVSAAGMISAICAALMKRTVTELQMADMLLPTSLVGSYAQPEWLIDRKRLAGRFPPRVRAKELWRVAPDFLEQAQDDATLLAIRDQERAGVDIITDGEMRRESYSNRFATALDGSVIENPGTALDRSGHPKPVPRVVGKI